MEGARLYSNAAHGHHGAKRAITAFELSRWGTPADELTPPWGTAPSNVYRESAGHDRPEQTPERLDLRHRRAKRRIRDSFGKRRGSRPRNYRSQEQGFAIRNRF